MSRVPLQTLPRKPSTPAGASEPDSSSTFRLSLRSKKATLTALMVISVVAAFTIGPDLRLKIMPASDSDKRFAIFTKSCVVPDYGPWHASVLPYVSTSLPINCTMYPAYSYTKASLSMNRIFINTSAMIMTADRTRAKPPIKCCYQVVYRPFNYDNDSITMRSSICVPVSNDTVIKFEFIRLLCSDAEGALVYKNFHAFVIRKPAVEKRCARRLGQRPTDGANDSDLVKTAPKRGKFAYSVLLVGADSLSRNNMKRSHSKTVKYLESRMGGSMVERHERFGRSDDQIWDNCTFLWTMFANAGYRTLYAEDNTEMSTFNYLKPGFGEQPTDYYIRPFLLQFEREMGYHKPLNCYTCVGPYHVAQVVLNYTRDFAITFRNEPYFAFTWINALTHDYASTRWGGDEIFLKFFQSLYEGGHLRNTIVVFLSDHGMRWGSIRRTFAGLLEGRLPGYLWYLPLSLTIRHPYLFHGLKENAHRLTTPLDVHATLRGVLEDFELLDAPNTQPFLRETQRKYDGIRMASLFTPVAEAVVRYINVILKPYAPRCARLSLQHVEGAYAHIIEDPRDSVSYKPQWFERLFGPRRDVREYTVSLVTTPGDAVFEATARVFGGAVTVMGEVLRISLYGNSSHCVPTMPYRKFCYCLQPASTLD
ncbi:hypothetical protein MTO96_015433 [Rhipicephalus appendiculatus]